MMPEVTIETKDERIKIVDNHATVEEVVAAARSVVDDSEVYVPDVDVPDTEDIREGV